MNKSKGINKQLLFVGIIIGLIILIATIWIAMFIAINTIASREAYVLLPVEEDPPESIRIPADPPFKTPDPQVEPEQAVIEVTGNNYLEQGGLFELPINGATGWAAISLPLRSEPRPGSTLILTLTPGQGFTIFEEYGGWWYVQLGNREEDISGWVEHRGSFINLPDIVPSIIYNITNADASVMRSSGFEIPGITGQALYTARSFNPRLDRYEFIVPILYSTGKRISSAQQLALANGNTIIIYEAFRPRETQQNIVNNLRNLMDNNQEVRVAINAPPWGMGWFVSVGLSNHQRGAAVDASLGRVISKEARLSGNFIFFEITEFEEYTMPTLMHELSPQAAVFRNPVSVTTTSAIAGIPLADTITEGAVLLQGYFAEVGFTPLASEWWHFDDREGARIASGLGINGQFFTERIYSQVSSD